MTFEPQNEFEKSFLLAAKNPAYRPQFYKDLANSDIYMISEGTLSAEKERVVISKGENIKLRKIEYNGKLYIPVFSSPQRIKQVLKAKIGYIAMNSIELFKITKGSDLFLNYGSEICKEFTADEIESIIDGSIWKQGKSFTVEKDTNVEIGQPANYPAGLTAALSDYFSGIKSVKCAYVALMRLPETEERPHTLIGVECDGGWNEIVSGASVVMKDINIPDSPVDFVRITGSNDPDETYFIEECEPFYKRKKFLFF